jgi:hypothetical protein
MQKFTGIFKKSGSRHIITLPFDPNAAWGEKERHHVTGSVNGYKVRGALEQEKGQYVLALGPAWQRDSGLASGAAVDVELSPEGPQMESLPPDLTAALEADPQAKAFFECLATFYRKGYLRWLAGAKQGEKRAGRIAELVGLLKAGKKQR